MEALLKQNIGSEGSTLFPLLEERTCPYTSMLRGVYCIETGMSVQEFIKKNDFMKELKVAPVTRGPWKPKYFPIYYCIPERPTWIGLPRFYGLAKFGYPTHDKRLPGLSIDVHLSTDRTLRQLQSDAVDASLDVLERWGGTTIIADCGAGKSGIGAALICSLQKKTLWITPRTVLMHQARNDLLTWIPDCSIGWMQGKWNATKKRRRETVVHSDCCPDDVQGDIIIASIESLSQCEYPKDILESFGLVIIDEMHVLAAKTLVHVLPKLPSALLVGLTATPDRKDGLEKVLYWLVGPTSFVFKRLPSITGLRGTVQVKKVYWNTSMQPITNAVGIDFTSTTIALSKHPSRQQLLHTEIQYLLDNRRKVLVVTTFVDHGQALLDSSPDVKKFFLYSKSPTTDIQQSKEQETRLIIATYGFISVGYDDEDIDCILLATPRSNIQQTIGRIERSKIGKHIPIVVDIIDSIPCFTAMSYSRQRFYTSRGFSILANKSSNSSERSFLINSAGDGAIADPSDEPSTRDGSIE